MSEKHTRFVYPASLSETLKLIQVDQHSLSVYMEEMIHHCNEVNPIVRALLPEPQRRQRLLNETRLLRNEYPNPASRPILYGATVGVKDIFHVDGFVTRAGSELPPHLFAGEEAACVTKLKQAGALIMGKTVTTEFAYFEPGQTRNPHNTEHTPGGSSSGSAAAVAAGLCTLSLGTQTIGSVIRPAAFCGIVGYKPSLGRIDPTGLVFFSRTIDHVGLFTQDVEGMAIAASVLCDGWSDKQVENKLPVLGVPDGPYLRQADDAALQKFEEHVLMLQVAGYSVKRVPAFTDIEELNTLHRRMVFAEFAKEHEAWFDDFESLYRPRTIEAVQIGRNVPSAELDEAREHTLSFRSAVAELMDRVGIDLWICPPALGEAPLGIESTGDPNMNLPWTHAGMPAITIPAGLGEAGMPLGLQLVARFGADEALLQWVEAMSQLSMEAIYDE